MFSSTVTPLSTLLLCAVTLADLPPQPQVFLDQGIIKGLYNKSLSGRLYSSFEGIPYAKPPQGKYRFKEPVPPEPWLGIYNATKDPPKCLQVSFTGEPSGSEDCLYINIYTPKVFSNSEPEKLLDVIAFIHGGGFFAMESTFHKARWLLDKDVVFVTFNYRLGPLGFLSTEDEALPGNNGMKDQTLALKWIQQNIASFGGNPRSVTLAGISAGGASCHLHTLSPLSKGLFKGAMCMSGVGLNHWAIAKNPKQKALYIAEQLGCSNNDTELMVDCLRNRPAEHINAVTRDFWPWKFPSIAFAPVIEPPGPNAFLSEQPIEILRRKGAMDIPLLLSFTKTEGLNLGAALHEQPALFNELMERWDELCPYIVLIDDIVPSMKPIICNRIKEHYKIYNGSHLLERKVIKLIGDGTFLHGIANLAKLYSSLYKSPVYIYKFSYRGKHSFSELYTKDNLGVSHGDDMIYLTDTPVYKNFTSLNDFKMSQKMVDIWAYFAANGSLAFGDPVSKHYPKMVYTDIIDPYQMSVNTEDEIGEETFWDSIFSSIY